MPGHISLHTTVAPSALADAAQSHGLNNDPAVTNSSSMELSVVMPCLNEAETLATCIRKAQRALDDYKIVGEIIVADNGSTDGSRAIAEKVGARVVDIKERGYGAALKGGFEAANGKFIIMGDADDSYDFATLGPFVQKLREGYDLVMGNRFKGGIKTGAMPFLHRYLGNPVLSGIGRLFFGSPCGDFHCGLRGFKKDAILKMGLETNGMEFASEMVVKATLFKMRIGEVPTTLSPDGRNRPPHLRTWHDGWRHLRFLLLYSPQWLFLYPGLFLMVLGLTTGLWLWPQSRQLLGITFDVHTLVYSGAMILVGFQAVAFAMFAKIVAIQERLVPPDARIEKVFRIITLEKGLTVGVCSMAIGLVGALYAIAKWATVSFGPLYSADILRVVIASAVLLSFGSQIILSSFFLSVLRMRRKQTQQNILQTLRGYSQTSGSNAPITAGDEIVERG